MAGARMGPRRQPWGKADTPEKPRQGRQRRVDDRSSFCRHDVAQRALCVPRSHGCAMGHILAPLARLDAGWRACSSAYGLVGASQLVRAGATVIHSLLPSRIRESGDWRSQGAASDETVASVGYCLGCDLNSGGHVARSRPQEAVPAASKPLPLPLVLGLLRGADGQPWGSPAGPGALVHERQRPQPGHVNGRPLSSRR